MENYIKFLTSFLTDHDLVIDVNDYVRYSDEARTPILVDGRRLALPTERHCRKPSDETLIFHPLAENVVADITPVMKEIVRLGSINLNILFATYGSELLQLASDHGRQTNLTDAQIDLLAKLKSCKSSGEKNVPKIAGDLMMDASLKNQATAFIQLGLMRGRTYRGEKRHRACSVNFPMYERLVLDTTVPKAQAHYDITKDVRNTLIELHEAMFPAVGEEEAYGYAEVSNRTIAPFFVTYALTYAQLAGEYKARYKALSSAVQFTQQDEPPLLDWVDDLKDTTQVQKWASSIPDQSTFRAQSSQDFKVSETPAMQAPATAPAPVATAPEVKDDGIPYMGEKYINSQGQLAEVPPPVVNQGPSVPKDSMSPDEFLRNYSTGSPFAAVQNTQTLLKGYIEGYGKFWDSYMNKYRQPPVGLPHPTTIPKGMLPPAYPNHNPLPPGFFPGGPMTATVAPVGAVMPGMMPGAMPGMMPGMVPGMVQGMQPNGMMQQWNPYMQQPQQMYQQPPQAMYGVQPMGIQPAGYGVSYGGAVNNVNNHPAFAGSGVASGTVSPGTV